MPKPGTVEPVLAVADREDPDRLVAAARDHLQQVGVRSATLFLYDHGFRVLMAVDGDAEPLDGRAPEVDELAAALREGRVTVEQRASVRRAWVPVTARGAVLGVLGCDLAEHPEVDLDALGELGRTLGYLLQSSNRVSHRFERARRTEQLSLEAELVWDRLPPMRFVAPGVAVAAAFEPAYDIAGDVFDYSLTDGVLDIAIVDGMGHGLEATLVSGLAMGAIRHGWREQRPLREVMGSTEAVLASSSGSPRFVTAFAARLDVTDGRVSWLRAGHPAPLLFRDGQYAGELDSTSLYPLGLGLDNGERLARTQPASTTLEPGDRVLLYSDGIVEARARDGVVYGLEKLKEVVAEGLRDEVPCPALLRALIDEVVNHSGGELHDDATAVVVEWSGPPDE